jgi:cytochrome c oxidase cbb3-type subunit 3
VRRASGSALVAAAALAVLAAGCGRSRSEAAEGRLPGRQPVGPMPGAGEAPTAQNPLGDDAAARAEGRKLFFRYNCAGCHGDHGGGGMGPSLRDVDWLYGSDPGRVFDSIASGRAHGMPAWGTRIPEKHIWELVAYVRSLRTKDEPEPPE